MAICNLMTGTGFDVAMFGGYSMAWLAMVVLFFIIVFARRFLSDAGVGFNTLGAWIGGFATYILVVTFSCSTKWSLVAGIAGFLLGAFVLGGLLGLDDGGGY